MALLTDRPCATCPVPLGMCGLSCLSCPAGGLSAGASCGSLPLLMLASQLIRFSPLDLLGSGCCCCCCWSTGGGCGALAGGGGTESGGPMGLGGAAAEAPSRPLTLPGGRGWGAVWGWADWDADVDR